MEIGARDEVDGSGVPFTAATDSGRIVVISHGAAYRMAFVLYKK